MLSRRLLRIKVAQTIYGHRLRGGDIASSRKELLTSAQKCYDLYLLMLRLPVDVRAYALERIDLRRNKMRPTAEEKAPNLRFVENPIIELLDSSVELEKALGKLSWKGDKILTKSIYTGLQESDTYLKYMEAEELTWADHVAMVNEIFMNELEDNTLLEAHLEDISIFWLDDIGYAASFAVQTLSSVKEGAQEVKVQSMFKNDEDRNFALTLLDNTLLHYSEYEEIVDGLTKNWELERIATMDRILMITAIAELINCPTVPIKATLDEFIELAKYYSTPQSGTFINGILDKASTELLAQGKIQKTGRGLL